MKVRYSLKLVISKYLSFDYSSFDKIGFLVELGSLLKSYPFAIATIYKNGDLFKEVYYDSDNERFVYSLPK